MLTGEQGFSYVYRGKAVLQEKVVKREGKVIDEPVFISLFSL